MGFKSAVTKRAFCALRCRSIPSHAYRSILSLQYRPIVELDGHLGCLLQISPKCSKIITYLQNIHELINIINKLYNNINISKNTYKLWMKTGQIHSLSTPQAKQTDSLSERGFKNSKDSHDLKLRIITSTILQSTSKIS